MADKHNLPKGKMHCNCRLLPDHIVCKITQRNNIRTANTCDPALKLLNEEITSDIQNINKTYGRNTYMHTGLTYTYTTRTFWEDHTRSIQQSTSIHTKHFLNIQQQNNNHTQTYCELFHQTIHKHCQTRNAQDKQIH